MIGELFSAAILAATFVESILACRYDLQAYGYLLFQGFKLLLWTAVTFAASGVLIQTSRTSRNQLGPLGLVYAITPLFLILYVPSSHFPSFIYVIGAKRLLSFCRVLFITGFIYAYTIYHEKENAQQDDENAPLLSGETAS